MSAIQNGYLGMVTLPLKMLTCIFVGMIYTISTNNAFADVEEYQIQ